MLQTDRKISNQKMSTKVAYKIRNLFRNNPYPSISQEILQCNPINSCAISAQARNLWLPHIGYQLGITSMGASIPFFNKSSTSSFCTGIFVQFSAKVFCSSNHSTGLVNQVTGGNAISSAMFLSILLVKIVVHYCEVSTQHSKTNSKHKKANQKSFHTSLLISILYYIL